MLKLSFDSKTDIPQGLETYYTEKEGKFYLQVQGIEKIDSIEKALDKERTARREAEQKVKNFEERLGFLPDDFDKTQYNQILDASKVGGEIDVKLKEQRESITAIHEKELGKFKSSLEEKDNLIQFHVKDSALNRAIAESNIDRRFVPAVEAMMKSKIKLEGTEVYLNEKPISQAFKEWTESEDGKHYIAAQSNAGGGTNATKSGAGAAKTMPRSDFATMSPSQQMEASKSGIKLTD